MRAAFVVLCVALCTVRAAAQSADQLTSEGMTLLQADNYAGALARFDAALRLIPNSARAHANRANALERLQRYGEACEALERARNLDARDRYAVLVRQRIGDARCAQELERKRLADAERERRLAAARQAEETERQVLEARRRQEAYRLQLQALEAERLRLEQERQRLLYESYVPPPPKKTFLEQLNDVVRAVDEGFTKPLQAEVDRRNAALNQTLQQLAAREKEKEELQRRLAEATRIAERERVLAEQQRLVAERQRQVGSGNRVPTNPANPGGGVSRPVAPPGGVGVVPPPAPPPPLPPPPRPPPPGRLPGPVVPPNPPPAPPPPPPPSGPTRAEEIRAANMRAVSEFNLHGRPLRFIIYVPADRCQRGGKNHFEVSLTAEGTLAPRNSAGLRQYLSGAWFIPRFLYGAPPMHADPDQIHNVGGRYAQSNDRVGGLNVEKLEDCVWEFYMRYDTRRYPGGPAVRVDWVETYHEPYRRNTGSFDLDVVNGGRYLYKGGR